MTGADGIRNMKKTLNSLQHISMYLLKTMNLISIIPGRIQKNRRITIILHFTESRRLQGTLDNTLIQQGDNESQLYIEYKNTLSDKTKFETGYILETSLNDQNFYGESFDQSTTTWIKDIQKSNHFKYLQNVHALYVTLEHTFGKFGILAGLRAEQAFAKSHLITTDTIIPNNYFRLYPTIHVSYRVNENNEFQLNYSHRVNRPEGDELNPFAEYADPLNLRVGNPHLKPEDIHSIEAGFSYKRNTTTFIATLYDRYTYNGKTQITRYINDSILLTTRENLSKSNSADWSLSFPQRSVSRLL